MFEIFRNFLLISGSIGTDICGCCNVCKKVENEECGGLYNYYGECDEGFECKIPRHIPYQMTGTCGMYREKITKSNANSIWVSNSY